MKNLLFLVAVILLFSCTDDDLSTDNLLKSVEKEDIIEIKTTRNEWNVIQDGIGLKSATDDSNFVETKEVESTESVVLPELTPHIWIGNILRKSSIANCNYKPLIYPRTPITISLTLSGTSPKVISNPTFSSYLSYVQEQTGKGNFAQNAEFNLSIEQFTSYNELKVAFGSNVNSSFLFWGSSTETGKEEHTINKATGIYVKFFQTSFKAVMDYPSGSIATIPPNLIDSAVYINSISYGRLGIMTLETNSTAQYSKEVVNKVFSKIFSSGSSTLTTEEKTFLDGCDYKLYMIGGNGNTAVESFVGYQGFIQHIKLGKFSRNEPGASLFCTFNYVKDNSPVKTKFKFDIKREPVYVEMIKSGNDFKFNFFRSRSRVPTIAPPRIKFVIEKLTERWIDYNWANPALPKGPFYDDIIVQNAGYQTSMIVMQYPLFRRMGARRPIHTREGIEYEPIWEDYYTYTLKNDSPDYEVIGRTEWGQYEWLHP